MLRDILVRQFTDIRREEWPRALLMSAFFFLVIATYWILKPLKRGVVINHFTEDPITLVGMTFRGAEAEQFGKVLNLVFVYLVVIFFTYLARRYPRHYLVAIFTTLFAIGFALYASIIEHLSDTVALSFYVFGDMFNTVMVGIFWAFTDDLVGSEEAKRTYGIIGLGGVVGGFLGATLVNATVEQVGRPPLLLACVGCMVLITVIAFVVHRTAAHERNEDEEKPAAAPSRRSIALEGARLVFSSRYLLAIAGIIAVYELVSNVIDFQLAATVQRVIDADLEKDSFFALVGQITGVGSILVQLLLTSYVMKRFGVRIALLFLPAAILLSTSIFLVFPLLYTAAIMSASDNALNYSINQSAREALYVPTSSDVTFKAKAFIDMFVQRLAKVVSVLINLYFVSEFDRGVRWLSLVTLAMLTLWFIFIRDASRGFHRQTAEEEAS